MPESSSSSPKPNPSISKTPEQAGDQLMSDLEKALETRQSPESLRKLGNLLYQIYQSDRFPPQTVLSSLKNIYEKHQAAFRPPINNFVEYIRSFGAGLTKLCQLKLSKLGYPLGKYGANKDGVDGILGPKTEAALLAYSSGKPQEKPEVPKPPTSPRRAAPEATSAYPRPTPKRTFEPQITALYDQHPTIFTVANLHDHFGNSLREVQPFIIDKDPVTGEHPITFLGRPINGGLNRMVLPFLKIAEAEINRSGIKYTPRSPTIGGFKDRNMMSHGIETNVPSFHKYGLAFDIDAGNNGAKYDGGATNRGDIPDHVVLAMVKAGFNWGAVGADRHDYLHDDPMHFELRFPADSPSGQAIIESSEVGQKYWAAISPTLPNHPGGTPNRHIS